MQTQSELTNHFTENEIKAILEFFPQGLCAFDLETTGLSTISDKIIEIGAVKVTSDGKIISFNSLVNPEIPIPPHSTAIHHITNAMVAKSPFLDKALKGFLDFAGSLPLVAHNAKFDLGFVLTSIHQENMTFPRNEVYDSCTLARKLIPKNEIKNYKLSTLAEFFHCSLTNHHRADADAFACLQIVAGCFLRSSLNSNRDFIKKAGYFIKIDRGLERLEYEVPEHLQGLVPLLAEQELIEIKYRGGSLKHQYRPIKPIGFVPMPQGIVLYGICLLAHVNKSFVAHKIEAYRLPSPELKKQLEQKILEYKQRQEQGLAPDPEAEEEN